jgi:hypothetical protein
LLVCICCTLGKPMIKRGGLGSHLRAWRRGLGSHLCACLKSIPGFLSSYYVDCCRFHELSWELVVCVVDIGGIVDRHCLSFHFISSLQAIK